MAEGIRDDQAEESLFPYSSLKYIWETRYVYKISISISFLAVVSTRIGIKNGKHLKFTL